jgi:hypothetical protein
MSKRERYRFSDEDLAKARAAPLLDYVQGRGYKLNRAGHDKYSLEEHDSLIIDAEKNKWYWNSHSSECRNTLDFLTDFEHIEFKEAVYTLLKGTPIEPTARPQPKPKSKASIEARTLPARYIDDHRVFAYLTKQRRLSYTVVREMIARGDLYESAQYHNAVFVRWQNDCPNTRPLYYFERGTTTYGNPYRHEPPWSEKDYGLRVLGEDRERLYVFEAIIDAMSWLTLRMRLEHSQHRDTVLALGGVALNVLERQLAEQTSCRHLIVCTDADEGGNRAWEAITARYGDQYRLTRCAPPPPFKDWNEALCGLERQEIAPARVRESMNIVKTES